MIALVHAYFLFTAIKLGRMFAQKEVRAPDRTIL
jgi:hypothetical protein